ncbi:MAG: hypothetical protein A4E63_00171 [Syntrophorhabdus sp. PtaU1.Bin050]|nr:MAG: hypothetical protein A4E63_00171 [Syntrophorhabdus sp. PtaU1.Bin050]
MGDYLCIRIGKKLMTVLAESLFDFDVIFNDAVMDDGNIPCRVGMGIPFRRYSVGGPSRMGKPHGALEPP